MKNNPKLFKCKCQHFGFLEVYRDDEPHKAFEYSFMITYYPKTIQEKLQCIWNILKGAKYGISDDILLDKKQVKELVKFLNEK